MNKREVFDTIKAHALKQGKRAVVDDLGGCRYRADDGCTCFIGCLIPDECYDPKMEKKLVGDVLEAFPCVAALFDDSVDEGFLGRMQLIHDIYEPEGWAEQFDLIEATL